MKLHIFEKIFFHEDGSIYTKVPSTSIVFESLSEKQIKSLSKQRQGSLVSEVRTSVLKKITQKYKHRFKFSNRRHDHYTVPLDIYIDSCRRKVRYLSGMIIHFYRAIRVLQERGMDRKVPRGKEINEQIRYYLIFLLLTIMHKRSHHHERKLHKTKTGKSNAS